MRTTRNITNLIAKASEGVIEIGGSATSLVTGSLGFVDRWVQLHSLAQKESLSQRLAEKLDESALQYLQHAADMADAGLDQKVINSNLKRAEELLK